MKLVSDFDGVWTFPDEESRAQGEVLDRALIESSPEAERAAAAVWVRDARDAASAEPTRYGWAPGGKLSCFGDEDPFAFHSALLHYLLARAADGDAMALRMRDAVIEQHGSIDKFGGWSHAEGVKQVAETRGPGVLAAAADAGRHMLESGIEVVVVSNSGTDKLAHWFEHAGVPHTVHPEGRPGALRLRGSGRKFILDSERSDPIDIGGVSIETARPFYEEALKDEVPDAIVGDVFSLDLALPLALKRRGEAFANMRLFWLMQPYSPPWLRESVIAAAGDEVELVEGGLAGVAQRLVGKASAS